MTKSNATDRALEKFSAMMIEKIESFKGNWKKPWFTEGALTWARNLSGREYNGMNALMLMMYCEQQGYKSPIFCTFDRAISLNFVRTSKGMEKAKDKDGNELPRVSINKGEKSFPVFLTTFTVVHKKTQDKIPYDDYKQLTDKERDEYVVYPSLKVYNVFNIDQTNIKDARPELYTRLTSGEVKPMEHDGNDYTFSAMDSVIENNKWICPIKPRYGNDAYYRITTNEIVVPEKKQFKDGESFYSNLFHEMAHSTGAENVLNRLKKTPFGSPEYAKEELVAELTAALVSMRYGIDKHIKDDSVAYLKSWLKMLKEKPTFIKEVLTDVKKASSMITKVVDEEVGYSIIVDIEDKQEVVKPRRAKRTKRTVKTTKK